MKALVPEVQLAQPGHQELRGIAGLQPDLPGLARLDALRVGQDQHQPRRQPLEEHGRRGRDDFDALVGGVVHMEEPIRRGDGQPGHGWGSSSMVT